MGQKMHKFTLLMWKNWVLLKRKKITTAFEVLFPIVLCFLLVSVRDLIKTTEEKKQIFEPFQATDVGSFFFPTIAYSPQGNIPDAIIKSIFNDSIIIPFRDTEEICSALDNHQINVSLALQFDDVLAHVSDLHSLPNDANITIRLPSDAFSGWYTTLLYSNIPSFGPRSPESGYGGSPFYAHRQFLALQEKIATKIINFNGTLPLPEIFLDRYPYPKWLNDPFYSPELSAFIVILLMMSFMSNNVNTIKSITTEKEKQLKESMKIMGLPGWLHWLAWFIRTAALSLLTIIVMIIVLKHKFKVTPIFTKSDGSVLFVFFLLYSFSNITFSFFVSVFFSKANTAAAIGSLFFFLSYLPYSLQQHGSNVPSLFLTVLSSFMPNSAFAFGVTQIIKFEAASTGIQWSNICEHVTPDDKLKFSTIMLMLVIDTILYFLLAIYIETIYPGEFGVPQKWYFPVSKQYWYPEPSQECENIKPTDNEDCFEAVTSDHLVGIKLRNLSKRFGGNKAVRNLSLEMYEGQITVLLGHNGAGKTTTMAMITGMFTPSSGTAIINGFDVRTNPGRVRDSMGLCLQHNVLFDSLTVKEHLYFFGKLKGLPKDQIDKEVNMYLKLLEFEDKQNAQSCTLSGGMKRKLSVGIALCGNSKVVILDEPTAGMDPSARRAIWNILQHQKEGRTILLTTHFMDEADLLGDRIAIMTSGHLQCCGSSFFLKKKYGAGYYLIMDIATQCEPGKVTNLLQKHIPSIQIKGLVGSELSYQLSEQDSEKFEAMLHDLESNITSLGVRSYGISLTTLEEVFMKVGADQTLKDPDSDVNDAASDVTVTILKPSEFLKVKKLKGGALVANQVKAIFLKKFWATLRIWYLIIFQLFLPIVLLVTTVLNARNYVPKTFFPPLTITLDSYPSPVTLMEGKDNIYSKTYRALFKNSEVASVDDVTEFILDLSVEDPSRVKNEYIIGASFGENSILGWFNGEPFHSPPLALSAVLNTIYRTTVNQNKSLVFINHPLPLSLDDQITNLEFNVVGYQIGTILGFGLAFSAAFFVLFAVKERISKFKHLEFVSGVKVLIFWGVAFLADFLIYLVVMVAVLITLVLLHEEPFKDPDDLGRLTLILLCFGCHVIFFIYVISHVFDVPSTGFSRIMLLAVVFGMIGVVLMQVLEVEQLELLYIARPLHWVFLLVPFYSVAKGVYDLSTVHDIRKLCTNSFGGMEEACQSSIEICCRANDYYAIKTPGIGGNLIVSFLIPFAFFGVLVLHEFGLFSKLVNKVISFRSIPLPVDNIEEDVADENQKIQALPKSALNEEHILVLKDVTKYYRSFLAVNGVCLGVKPFECFGLLGVNGAGKTTTFKMMTGDEQISYGDAWVDGLSVRNQHKKVQKLIGYCPQFDALLDDLTARETLKIFALIRGVPPKECKSLGEKLASEFDFYKHLDKRVCQLSGGNKRKLSTALALIGDPPVIFLDEPTTGMDPATKRYLWTALNKLRENGKCIILTSHSMEECEALCTRIAIMVNGTFQCLGSTQRLKNKFAQGFSLTIKTKKIDENFLEMEVAKIDCFVKKNFPGAELKEKYQELLSYQLGNNDIPWSKMFGILERSKRDLNIEDYSLGQCSLEQVFLSFTKAQR